jgi:hypothetical protein
MAKVLVDKWQIGKVKVLVPDGKLAARHLKIMGRLVNSPMTKGPQRPDMSTLILHFCPRLSQYDCCLPMHTCINHATLPTTSHCIKTLKLDMGRPAKRNLMSLVRMLSHENNKCSSASIGATKSSPNSLLRLRQDHSLRGNPSAYRRDWYQSLYLSSLWITSTRCWHAESVERTGGQLEASLCLDACRMILSQLVLF